MASTFLTIPPRAPYEKTDPTPGGRRTLTDGDPPKGPGRALRRSTHFKAPKVRYIPALRSTPSGRIPPTRPAQGAEWIT
ncbi:hypothetical protein Scel_58490 [Streptomyces cellostaticus]|nr:hypothetical protein Scel_58490 [Streptomyces cellostaticus]